MSFQNLVLASTYGIPIAKPKTERCMANFPPAVSTDHYLSNSSHVKEIKHQEEHHKLKEQVAKMLTMAAAVDKPGTEKLCLIDAIQRLGVSYHFEEEINEILRRIYATHLENCNAMEQENDDHSSLYSTALLFRLLRQHGYRISYEIFNKFKDDEGNFKESFTQDVQGMLSLYEATHLRIHGEDILEEALVFTTNHLKPSMAVNLSPLLSTQISHALSIPLRKSMPRLEAKYYISVYEQDPTHNEILLTFAKLDFNILQAQHQQEIWDLSRWWNDLDISRKLPFARDRIAELYFWSLGTSFEPQDFIFRKLLTKVTGMCSILDDIYDAYGTLEELQLLTQSLNDDRWDINATNNLPESIQVFYKEILLGVYKEFEDYAIAEGRLYVIHYAKEMIKMLARAYLTEAKWRDEKKIPTMEEYKKIGVITSVFPLMVSTAFIGMGKNVVTKDAVDWVFTLPKFIKACSMIYRLLDDITSHEFEKERGDPVTSIQCYMKQHGVTNQEAINEIYRQVSNALKDMNEEFLQPERVLFPLLMRMFNLSRVGFSIYKDGDGYTFSQDLLKDHIAALLVHPVLL